MRRVLVVCAAVLAVAALGLAGRMGSPPAQAVSPPSAQAVGHVSGQGGAAGHVSGQAGAVGHVSGQGGAISTGSSGEFIIRCPMTGEVQAIDPIMDPGPGKTAPHVHMFFGNPNGTDNVQSTTTYADLNDPANKNTTTCQDPADTAAYWAPESFYKSTPSGTAKPYLPGCKLKTDGSGNYNCGTDTDTTIYIRAYYLTSGHQVTSAELPPGLIMVAGTPDATKAPKNDNVIEWDCGANTLHPAGGKSVKVHSPESIWPYDCSIYQHDKNLKPQGPVEVINFPSCFNGKASYPSPNGDGPGGNTDVPGYFDPSLGSMSDNNDLSYAVKGSCGSDKVVPKVSMRIHYIALWTVNDDGKTIYPSSCAGAQNLSVQCKTQQQVYGTTAVPTDIGLELSSTQTGGKPGPWYTEHADYWQTWQQGKALGPDPNTGTLNSLSYYCLVEDVTCGFMPSSKPGNPPYPPPPGH